MTAATAPLCGRRWRYGGTFIDHDCVQPAGHHTHPCRCACGATTTRERTDR